MHSLIFDQQARHAVTFTPAGLKDCGTTNAPGVVEVHWDASKANPKQGVKIWGSNDSTPKRTAASIGDRGSLWTSNGDTGSATTGAWSLPGTTITVTNAKDDAILAIVKMPSAPCK